eukprot:5563600-Pleurochrysis_carterae.AAC.1
MRVRVRTRDPPAPPAFRATRTRATNRDFVASSSALFEPEESRTALRAEKQLLHFRDAHWLYH